MRKCHRESFLCWLLLLALPLAAAGCSGEPTTASSRPATVYMGQPHPESQPPASSQAPWQAEREELYRQLAATEAQYPAVDLREQSVGDYTITLETYRVQEGADDLSVTYPVLHGGRDWTQVNAILRDCAFSYEADPTVDWHKNYLRMDCEVTYHDEYIISVLFWGYYDQMETPDSGVSYGAMSAITLRLFDHRLIRLRDLYRTDEAFFSAVYANAEVRNDNEKLVVEKEEDREHVQAVLEYIQDPRLGLAQECLYDGSLAFYFREDRVGLTLLAGRWTGGYVIVEAPREALEPFRKHVQA